MTKNIQKLTRGTTAAHNSARLRLTVTSDNVPSVYFVVTPLRINNAAFLAAIDRVVHHSVVLDLMAVESYRAKAAGAKPKTRKATEETAGL